MQHCMKLIVALFVAFFGGVKAASTHDYAWAFGKETQLVASADTEDVIEESTEDVVEEPAPAPVVKKPVVKAKPVYEREKFTTRSQAAVEKEKSDFKMTRWQKQQKAAQIAAQARQAAANRGH